MRNFVGACLQGEVARTQSTALCATLRPAKDAGAGAGTKAKVLRQGWHAGSLLPLSFDCKQAPTGETP